MAREASTPVCAKRGPPAAAGGAAYARPLADPRPEAPCRAEPACGRQADQEERGAAGDGRRVTSSLTDWERRTVEEDEEPPAGDPPEAGADGAEGADGWEGSPPAGDDGCSGWDGRSGAAGVVGTVGVGRSPPPGRSALEGEDGSTCPEAAPVGAGRGASSAHAGTAANPQHNTPAARPARLARAFIIIVIISFLS